MTWQHTCPRCGVVSTRHWPLDRMPVCAHDYHDAKDCGVCADCRTGAITDASGRFLTSDPHQAPAARAPGPWDQNTTGE